MVNLKPVIKENYNKCLELKVSDEQKRFVATNIYTMAQAYIYRDSVKLFAITVDEEIVGFTMLSVDKEKYGYCIWRFMIDQHFQNKGYGKAAMRLIVDFLIAEGAEQIKLSYSPDNTVADHLYRSFGFLPTGEIDDGEIVMKLEI